jgi:hypothetical protein
VRWSAHPATARLSSRKLSPTPFPPVSTTASALA